MLIKGNNNNNNNNFNEKYYLLWFKLKFYGGSNVKFGVIWIKSWKHRYITVGHVQYDSIAANIGIQYGDRLGYINGIIAPNLKQFENELQNKNKNDELILRLGILRKHYNSILYNLLSSKCSNDEQEHKDIVQTSTTNLLPTDDIQQQQQDLKYYFIANSYYENHKEPELYKFDDDDDCFKIINSSLIESFTPTRQSTPIQNSCIHNLNDSSFIKNKENFVPFNNSSKSSLMMNDCKQQELRKVLKKYELVTYEKRLYHRYPDQLVKPKIDKHIKSQRVLRELNL